MNVNPVNIYNKYEVEKDNPAENIQRLINQNSRNQKIAPTQDDKNSRENQLSLELKNGKDIITQQERSFFVKMFPESGQKLENHVLFNRNGRLNTDSFQKGTIVDARV